VEETEIMDLADIGESGTMGIGVAMGVGIGVDACGFVSDVRRVRGGTFGKLRGKRGDTACSGSSFGIGSCCAEGGTRAGGGDLRFMLRERPMEREGERDWRLETEDETGRPLGCTMMGTGIIDSDMESELADVDDRLSSRPCYACTLVNTDEGVTALFVSADRGGVRGGGMGCTQKDGETWLWWFAGWGKCGSSGELSGMLSGLSALGIPCERGGVAVEVPDRSRSMVYVLLLGLAVIVMDGGVPLCDAYWVISLGTE
jgi:hypothetical protein